MNRLRSGVLILLATSLAACGDSTSPSAAVVGSYHATAITATPTGGSPLNVLALGGSLNIVLTAQGTTSGTLVVPAVLTEGGVADDVIDLAGTYTVTGNTVHFQMQGDSFIPDSDWTIGSNTLSTSLTTSQSIVQATLTKS